MSYQQELGFNGYPFPIPPHLNRRCYPSLSALNRCSLLNNRSNLPHNTEPSKRKAVYKVFQCRCSHSFHLAVPVLG